MSDLQQRLSRVLEGRYRVTRELGRGGMAVVYEAEDLKHARSVAVKVMKPEVAHDLGAERFLREIEIAARLAHPNILPLHDSGESDGLLYFVMPSVEGDTLRERLTLEGPLAVGEAIRITKQIADALGFAHERGLIHRDVKPENILFQAGHALVGDFGIARAVSEAGGRTLTQTGVAPGTLRYMSPEQAAGEVELDARTDVYSLGCVLYEMLTGEAPFADSAPAVMLARKVTEDPPAVAGIRADVPPTIEGVLSTALARERSKRFATPGVFAQALAEAATAQAIEADADRRRRSAGLRRGLAAAAIVLLGAMGWWITGLMDRPAYERVAVLPLESATNDAEMAYFLDGVHVDLTRELMKAGVRVINPTSMQRYRDTDLPIGEIARELGVDAIIQGTASLQDEEVSLDLFMTDGSNDEIVWNASFGSGMRDLLSLYGDIVRGVAAAAGFELSAESDALMAAAPPVNPQVQEFLWWARFHRSKLTRTGLDLALDYYQRALDLDPQNAQALAGVSGVWGSRAQMGFISAAEARTHGDSAFAAALASDSLDAEVQYALATSRTWRDWEFEVGRQSFVRALEADPTNSLLRALYSHLLYYLDRDQEAREQIEIAVQSDPLSAQIRTYYGMDLVYERDWASADSVLTAVIRDEPNYRMAVTTLRTLYHMTGEHERALDMWRRSNASDAEVLVALDEGAEPGGYPGALRAVAELFIARSDTMHITPWQIGTLYTRSGDYDLAIDYLERAFEERDQNIPYLSVDPIFDPMRDTPRFGVLVERLGLPG